MTAIERSRRVDGRLFFGLLAAAVAGQIAVIPYVFSLFDVGRPSVPVPLPVAVILQIAQGAVLAAIAIFLGLRMAGPFGLGLPFVRDWSEGRFDGTRFARTATISVALGAAVAVVIFVLDRFVFTFWVEAITVVQERPPLWQRTLVCLYGGVNEEIFLRLFLMTLLVWLGSKIAKRQRPATVTVWVAIIVVSITFGLGHLPMTARFTPLTPIVILRAIVLNGIAGIVFGWLYWRRGLETAMIAHFSTDVVLHVLLPLAIQFV